MSGSGRFFVVGAHKAATTSLCELLAQHPEIAFSDPKEPAWFCYPDRMSFEDYQRLFPTTPRTRAWGDGTTGYSVAARWPEVPARIAARYPDATILYAVREPFARLRSAVQQKRHEGEVDPGATFAEVLRSDPFFLDAGRYWKQLQRYAALFPPDRIHVVFFDEFVKDPVAVAQRCYAAVGVDPTFVPRDATEARNASATHTEEPRWLWRLRQLKSVTRLVPLPVRQRLLGALWRRVRTPQAPRDRDAWDPETRAWVWSELADDNRRFLVAHGRPADLWDPPEARPPCAPRRDRADDRGRG